MTKLPLVPVPFTVIGGFLGAGKTTLLNRLLTEPAGVRYAILVNDFGELNIDESLVKSHDGQTISLTNGCVCCSIANDFIETVINLVNRIEEFDQVIVEASGVAEPNKIMDIARLDPELTPNGIIVVVDAAEIKNRFDDPYVGSVVQEQLRTAELLIINKTDLVHPNEVLALEAWLTQVAPSVSQLKTVNANIAPALVFGSFQHNLHPLQSHAQATHEAPPFQSLALQSNLPTARLNFEQWCQSLPASVIRGKGILYFQEDLGKKWIWQKVGRRETFEAQAVAGERPQSKMLLIGTEAMPSAQAIGAPAGFEAV